MQTMKMKLAQSLAALAVVFTGSAFAKTVAWYHFDEGAPGTYATTSMEILNALDETTLIGTPGTRGTGVTDDFLPKFVDEFATYTYLVDPVAGTTNANHRSLAFKRADNASGQVNRLGGSVAVAADATLSLSTLTVEFFVRPDDASGGMQWVAKRNGSNTGHFTYSICLNAGKPYVNVYSLVEGQMTLDPSTGASKFAYSKSIADGTWHHVALTVDPSADADHPTAKLYVDYVLRATVTLANPLCNVDSGANGTLYLGMSSMGYYAPAGSLDEVRISDSVLTPEQFLRWENIHECDAAIRLGFDNAFDYTAASNLYSKNGTEIPNEVRNPKFSIVLSKDAAGAIPTFMSEGLPFTSFWRGLFSEDSSVTNRGALEFNLTEGTTKGVAFLVDDKHAISSGSFTMECRCKMSAVPTATTYFIKQSYTDDGTKTAFQVYVDTSGKLNFGGTKAGGSFTSGSLGTVCDGAWHRVAMVYDCEARTVVLYLDGTSKTWTDFEIGTGTGTEKLKILGETTSQQFAAVIDEYVITRKALKPWEFVTARHESGAVPFAVGFDDETLIHPVDVESYSGTLEKASYSETVPGQFVYDGADGEDSAVTNAKSIFIEEGSVKFPHYEPLEMDAMTVEFFVKYKAADGYAGLLRFCQANDNYMTTPIWNIGFNVDGTQISMRVDTEKKSNQGHSFGSSFLNGRWHHLAVTFEPTENGDTCIRMYDNYEQVGDDWTVEGKLDYSKGSCLGIGTSSVYARFFTGYIDSLRISKGVLEPSRFLRVKKTPRGFILIYK